MFLSLCMPVNKIRRKGRSLRKTRKLEHRERGRERDDLMIKEVSKGANMTKRREEWGGWRGFGLGKRELERAGKTETDHLKVMREGLRR